MRHGWHSQQPDWVDDPVAVYLAEHGVLSVDGWYVQVSAPWLLLMLLVEGVLLGQPASRLVLEHSQQPGRVDDPVAVRLAEHDEMSVYAR